MSESVILEDIDDQSYHSDRASLSSSGARLLLPPGCPAKFKQRMDCPPPPSRVFDFGTLAHSMVLGKGAELVVLEPEIHGLTKDGSVAANPRATATWKAAEAEARESGRLPVHIEDWAKAQAMAAQVLHHPMAGPLFREDGRAEVSIYADDPVTGVRLRARPDWMFDDADGRLVIVDLKTTADAYPQTWVRSAAKYGYEVQFAWYVTVAKLAGLSDSPAFLFVNIEKESPYLISVVELDAEAFEAGLTRMRQAIDIYAKCIETDTWPGYGDGIHLISLPPWALPHRTTMGDLLGAELES